MRFNNPGSPGASGVVQSVVGGADISVDSTNTAAPVVNFVPAGNTGDVQIKDGATLTGLPVIGFPQWADGGANEVPISDGAGSGTWGPQSGGGGGVQVIGPIVCNFDDAEFANTPFTKAIYVPAVGQQLYDVWIGCPTAWNGTDPKADVGTFVNSTTGLFASIAGNPVLLNFASAEFAGDGVLVNSGGDLMALGAAGGATCPPCAFIATNPLKVCISTTGATNGSATGGTAGVANIFLVVADPVAP